jgi:CheY-like chemotaxis protein
VLASSWTDFLIMNFGSIYMPPGTILYVENCPEDVELLTRMFKSLKVQNQLVSAGNGEEAFFYLMGSGPYGDRSLFPYPGLVLLDIGLPGWDGFQVLQSIRAEKSLHELPVIMFSNSDAPEDKARALKLGANGYLTKTASRARLYEALTNLNHELLGANFPDAVIELSPPKTDKN